MFHLVFSLPMNLKTRKPLKGIPILRHSMDGKVWLALVSKAPEISLWKVLVNASSSTSLKALKYNQDVVTSQ